LFKNGIDKIVKNKDTIVSDISINDNILGNAEKANTQIIENSSSANVARNNKKDSGEIQNIFLNIFRDILSVPEISIEDDLFELGIDSIKAMQAVARLQKHSLELKIKDIFGSPNIKKLISCIKTMGERSEYNQKAVEGNLKLTPVQKWFFEQKLENTDHYNQALMLHSENGFNSNIVKKCFEKLVIHHDALRMIFQEDENNSIIQKNLNEKERSYDFFEIDFDENETLEVFLKEKSTLIHKRCDIGADALLRVGLFKTKNQGDYLLVTIHHLVIDAVSLRILTEDFSLLYSAYIKNRTETLPAKTDSFKTFSNKIYEYSSSTDINLEGSNWKSLEIFCSNELPTDYELSESSKKLINFSVEKICLNETQTKKLIEQSNKKLKIGINVLLITALGEAIKKWCGNEKTKIHLEGHGRDELFKNMNISRTVGWFTSLFPFIVDVSETSVFDNINSVKQLLDNLQNKTVVYGILKYLTHKLDGLEISKPEILFNFLGNFDDMGKYPEFSVYDINVGDLKTEMRTGEVFSLENKSPYKLEVSAQIINSNLEIFIAYNKLQYKSKTIRAFADFMKEILYDIEKTDFTNLEEKYYPVSSAQKRLFLVQEFDRDSTEYNLPLIVEAVGNLDKNKIRNIFCKIVERHETLRTSFELKNEVYQRINSNVVLNFECEKINKNDINAKIKEFIQPFDLRNGNLFRIKILETEDSKCFFIMMDMHHIISDGFSSEIIINEFIRLYNFDNLSALPITFKELVNLQNKELRDKFEVQEGYWINKFKNLPERISAPYDYPVQNLNKKISKLLNFEVPIKDIKKLANESKITLNNVLFAVYKLVLSKMVNSEDIITGIVSSGRDNILSENLIGMFVNTLPVRQKINKETSFSEFLKSVQHNVFEAFENQLYPLDELVNKLNIKRNNRNPLFTNMFAPQNITIDNIELNDLSIKIVPPKNRVSNFDFVLSPTQLNDRIFFELEYSLELYKEETANRFVNLYKNILEQITNNKNVVLNDLTIFSNEESQNSDSDLESLKSLDLEF